MFTDVCVNMNEVRRSAIGCLLNRYDAANANVGSAGLMLCVNKYLFVFMASFKCSRGKW